MIDMTHSPRCLDQRRCFTVPGFPLTVDTPLWPKVRETDTKRKLATPGRYFLITPSESANSWFLKFESTSTSCVLYITRMYPIPATASESIDPDTASSYFDPEICEACYAAKRSCVYYGDPKLGCRRCVAKGKVCKPREPSASDDDVVRNIRDELGAKARALDQLLSSQISPTSTTYIEQTSTMISAPNSPNGPGPLVSPTREPRSGQRAPRPARRHISHPSGTVSTLDAVHVAMFTSVVAEGILRPSEVVELCHKFMTRWNPCILVLDPNIHTIEFLSRSEFLLTVVLAVAAQDYECLTQPRLCEKLIHRSRKIGVEEILHRTHNLETVQSFLLLSLFPDWKAPVNQNRSWLDLGLALDLAKQMNMGRIAGAYNHDGASPSERNVFRTWMICHNLDVMSTLLFDKSASLSGWTSPRDDSWPGGGRDNSLESIVGTLTVPLRRIDAHLKQQTFHNTFYGADLVPAVKAGEHTGSPKLVDSEVIGTMTDAVDKAKTANSGSQRFWSHLAHTTTEYSRLLLLSKYASRDTVMNDPKTRSQMLGSAVSILQSYVDVFGDFDCAKFAPGNFFAFGVLASAVAHRFSTPTDADFGVTSSLIERFSKLLQTSPAAGGKDSRLCSFVSILEQWGGGTSEREEMRSQEQAVSMMTSVFPAWWRLFL